MWIVPEFMKFGNEAGGGAPRDLLRRGGFAVTKPKARGFWFGFERQDRDLLWSGAIRRPESMRLRRADPRCRARSIFFAEFVFLKT
jgi:hypothetical protein